MWMVAPLILLEEEALIVELRSCLLMSQPLSASSLVYNAPMTRMHAWRGRYEYYELGAPWCRVSPPGGWSGGVDTW